MRYAVHRQEPFWHALGYVFLLFVTQIIGNMCFRHKDHILAKVGIRLKSALALCVYNKVGIEDKGAVHSTHAQCTVHSCSVL